MAGRTCNHCCLVGVVLRPKRSTYRDPWLIAVVGQPQSTKGLPRGFGPPLLSPPFTRPGSSSSRARLHSLPLRSHHVLRVAGGLEAGAEHRPALARRAG